MKALLFYIFASLSFAKSSVENSLIQQAPEELTISERRRDEQQGEKYKEKFPYYAEYCGLSKISKKQIKFGLDVQGGKGGHGLIYLHGACRKELSNYPEIEICEKLSKEDRAGYAGVGISVNSDFKNANWIAVPGENFFFYGDLSAAEPLTKSSYLKIRERAKELKILRGVEFHPELFAKHPEVSAEEFMWEDTFGTDYAFNLAREAYCVKVPLSKLEMQKAVDYLNDLNSEIRDGKKDYKWSGIYNNCTHTAHNALAAAGIWNFYKTDVSLPRQLFNLAIPLNEFATLMGIGNDIPYANPLAMYRSPVSRASILQNRELPTRPGVIGRKMHVHAPNEIFSAVSDALVLELKFLRTVAKKIDRYLSNPRYGNLDSNLKFHRELRDMALNDLEYFPSPEEAPDYPAFFRAWQESLRSVNIPQ